MVEVMINNEYLYVHITNTGRLLEYIKRGNEGLLIPINGKKLRYRLVGVWGEGYYALIDTKLQCLAFEKLVSMDAIPWLVGYEISSKNPPIGVSLLDYKMVSKDGDELYIETKSAVLRGESGEAMYPDCPSLRGRRHIEEIIKLREHGYEAMIVFIAGIKGVRCFKPYAKGDPIINRLLKKLYYIDSSSIRCISIYLDRSGWVILDNPDVNICIEWLENSN